MDSNTRTSPPTWTGIDRSHPAGERPGKGLLPPVDPRGLPGSHDLTDVFDRVELLLLAVGMPFELVHDGRASSCPAHLHRSRRPAA